jgi:SNF family Na+-dependent transporter
MIYLISFVFAIVSSIIEILIYLLGYKFNFSDKVKRIINIVFIMIIISLYNYFVADYRSSLTQIDYIVGNLIILIFLIFSDLIIEKRFGKSE